MTAFASYTTALTQATNAARTRALQPPKNVYAPYTPQQVYSFFGSLTNIVEVSSYSFFVLAGDGSPTITAGFVKLNILDRPQRKGFTIPSGYDPITMDVPIQFEAVMAQPTGQFAITADVEYDIATLEWMAGRGKRFAATSSNGVGAPATGDPPLVLVASYDGSGNETNLIPPNVQGVQWVISNIDYDTAAYRNRSGDRIRQAATVTLTEFVASEGTTADSPTVRAKARNVATASYRTYLSTSALNTLAKMTNFYTGLSTEAAYLAVVNANKATLKVRSRNQTLPAGSKVLIPTILQVTPT